MSGEKPSQTAARGWCGPERSDYPAARCARLGLDGEGAQPLIEHPLFAMRLL
jgi:hypothetical protein